MAKRPQGLHKAALAKKKQKTQDVGEAVANPAPTEAIDETGDDEEVTFQFDKDVDPNNELESLFAIYDSYQNSNFPPKLVYLLIHTSDNILRLHSKKLEREESGETSEKKEGDEVDPIDLIPNVLPPQFHNIYATSLLAMSRIVEDEDDDEEDEEEKEKPKKTKTDEQKDTAKDFIAAALDRVNAGLDSHPDSFELLFTRARANIVKVAEQLKRDTVNTFRNYPTELLPALNEALTDFEKAEKIILADTDKKYSDQELIAIQLLLDIGEHIGNNWELASARENEEDEEEEDDDDERDAEYAANLKLLRDTYLDWSKERYLNMAKVGEEGKGKTALTGEVTKKTPFQIQREATLGIGKYYLAKAAPYIEEYEEAAEMFSDDEGEGNEEADENEAEAKRLLGVLGSKAREYMTKSLEYLLKSENEEDGDNLVLIAEAQLSLANLLEDEGEQELLYKEASLRLKKAQRLGAGDFTELIRDLQQ